MISPECANCVGDTPGDDQTRSVNIGVVLGVLGGMALIALVVFAVVPVARRQTRRRVGSRGDEESGFLPSRRSSSRHQKMQLEEPAGPDVLLPLIDPVSTITWSDLRSKNASADSFQEAGLYSFRTGDATTSHPSFDASSSDSDMDDTGQQDACDAQMSAGALKHSPTPPGLPSKIGASTATAAPSYSSTPAAVADSALHAGMYPLSPVSPVLSMSRGASRSRPGTARPGMEPLLEDGGGSPAEPPPLRQLPSPPSSPDQYEPNYRGSASRRRPSVTSNQTAPSVLPYRPRSSTTTSLPLSAAFRTSLLSGTPSAHASSSTPPRYPTLAVPVSRSRASSVSLAPIPDVSPTERPMDAVRRMSTTELRHRHPLSTTAATASTHSGSHSATHGSGSQDAMHGGHASGPSRMPDYGEAGPSSWQRRSSMQLERSPPTLTSSPSPLSPPPSARPFRPLPVPGAQSASTARPTTAPGPHTQPHPPAHLQSQSQLPSQPHQHLPALVRKRDSPALRPLPASPFAYGGAGPAVSRQPSTASTRTRSSSVMSERSLPRQLPPLAPLPPLDFNSDFATHGDSDSRSVRSRRK
ncbi:uncharacterized protein C8Q71DRAFT_859879 [Rhodofomes roseus]|uniref:Uncharacterized protein n=1 Tax=Rhodofomes roseus TaxID=34475 RepID=A0ABQ8KAD7_9APHY|nr:uncharacterized protein C8Q71DRAFT_859879 [Rhodofomes roseus]KAH9834224.1 hypothetical protein C8Q71DRAFT_859879 [Rhodofomes roseus]